MKKLIALAVVLGLGAAPATAAAGTQKTGRPFLPPPFGARAVEVLSQHSHALIQIDRSRAHAAVPLLRREGAVLVSPRLQIWRLPSGVARRLVPSLRKARALRAVEPDRPVSVRGHLSAGDPLLPSQWWVNAVGADQAEPPGPGFPVTVIDSGLDTTHPEFGARPGTAPLNGQSTGPGPGEEHGTAVSSVVAAPANGLGVVGVYPQANLFTWDGGMLTVADVIAGLEAAAAQGRGVINMSFGGDVPSFLEELAVLAAFGAGAVPVAAAGNEFQDGNPVEFPASYPHVLTVAATNSSDVASGFSNANLAIDLSAPGEGIPVAVPLWADGSGFTTFTGTSFAAPIVSGATAWVWTVRADLEKTQVFDLMRISARDVGEPGYDVFSGFGVVNIPAALAIAAPSVDPQEPNDDIFQIKANGLFAEPKAPLTGPGRPRRTVRARLDATEDFEDVYRVWVPGGRGVSVRVVGDGDVDVELWRPGTRSVRVIGKARRRNLIDASHRPGTLADTVAVFNSGRRGRFVFLDVFLPEDGPLSAGYRARVRTIR